MLTRWPFVIMVVCLALIGAVFMLLSAREAERVMKRTVLSQAQMLVESIDQERFSRLTATAADEQSADYHYLRDTLIRMQSANPAYRYLYLMGTQENGPPFFYMGTAPAGTDEYSPPGQPYPEEAPALAHVFLSGEATLSEPVTDRWGTWISALVPLRAPDTGRMLAVFGMDIDASDWRASIRLRTFLPGALALATIFLLLLLFFMVRSLQQAKTEHLLLRQNRLLAAEITERHRVEEELRASETKYRDLIENTSDIIYSLAPDGVFTYVSPAWMRLLGHSVGEVEGHFFHEFVHPDDQPTCFAFFAAVMDSGERMAGVEYRVRHANGEWRWHTSSASRFRDSSGVVVRYDGVARDITERKQVEEERERLQAQLTQVQKMESVGRLAGGVAHDFNNMLGVILGHTEVALEQVAVAEPLHAGLMEIQKAAQRSADLTRQLLAFARKQTIAPKEIDLNEALEGMLKLLRRLIGENIDLVWKPRQDLWPVKIDPSQLDQILANLCVNARDAIAGVGQIIIETDNATLDADYCARDSGFIPGDYVLLAVSDSGCGMDPATLLHLFEPFFTTKELGKGTGLGLATVYGAVKQNRGFINVYSEPGHGTTFKLHLPRHAAMAAPLVEGRRPDAAARGSETILVVEDETSILEMTKAMLEKLGYSVLTAHTPGEAINRAQEHSGAIDLLVTDVVMPEMNGRDLAKNLLSLYPSIRCLFMSGYTANVITHQGVLDKGVHFIQKPFLRNDLAARIREALEER